MNLNKSLLIVLAILVVVACSFTAVSAYSDEGSGSIDEGSSEDNFSSDDDLDSEVYYDSPSHEGGSNKISLTNHPTGNTLILLIAALTLVGSSLKFRR